MSKPASDKDANNHVVAVTLDEESIGRSGPDIEHERAIAIYDLVETMQWRVAHLMAALMLGFSFLVILAMMVLEKRMRRIGR